MGCVSADLRAVPSWPPRTAPPRSGSSRAGWWSATSATTSASPRPSPTRCCWPFAHEGTAAAVEAVYTEAVGAPSAGWSASAPTGMRGHHGDGQSAATVAGSGFLGWSMVHRAARAVDKLTQALVRNALHRRYGVSFARNACTGLRRVPAQALRAFAKRGASIEALLADLGFDPGEASRAVPWVAEQRTRGARTEAAAARGGGWDPVAIARRVLAGGGPDDADGPRDPDHGPPAAGPQSVAALAPAGRPGARADRAHPPVLPGGRVGRPRRRAAGGRGLDRGDRAAVRE